MTVADPAKMQAAHDLLAREGGWTQGAFARTAAGRVIGPSCAPASCFCPVGAIIAAGGGVPEREFFAAVCCGVEDLHALYAWNDAPDRTQAEVVAVAARAVELARAA